MGHINASADMQLVAVDEHMNPVESAWTSIGTADGIDTAADFDDDSLIGLGPVSVTIPVTPTRARGLMQVIFSPGDLPLAVQAWLCGSAVRAHSGRTRRQRRDQLRVQRRAERRARRAANKVAPARVVSPSPDAGSTRLPRRRFGVDVASAANPCIREWTVGTNAVVPVIRQDTTFDRPTLERQMAMAIRNGLNDRFRDLAGIPRATDRWTAAAVLTDADLHRGDRRDVDALSLLEVTNPNVEVTRDAPRSTVTVYARGQAAADRVRGLVARILASIPPDYDLPGPLAHMSLNQDGTITSPRAGEYQFHATVRFPRHPLPALAAGADTQPERETPVPADIIDSIDAAIGCQQCTRPLGDSVSDDFCSQGCQEQWHAARSTPLPLSEDAADVLVGADHVQVPLNEPGAADAVPVGRAGDAYRNALQAILERVRMSSGYRVVTTRPRGVDVYDLERTRLNAGSRAAGERLGHVSAPSSLYDRALDYAAGPSRRNLHQRLGVRVLPEVPGPTADGLRDGNRAVLGCRIQGLLRYTEGRDDAIDRARRHVEHEAYRLASMVPQCFIGTETRRDESGVEPRAYLWTDDRTPPPGVAVRRTVLLAPGAAAMGRLHPAVIDLARVWASPFFKPQFDIVGVRPDLQLLVVVSMVPGGSWNRIELGRAWLRLIEERYGASFGGIDPGPARFWRELCQAHRTHL